jgi:hypothetical protein
MSRLITLFVWVLCVATGGLGLTACSSGGSDAGTQPDPTKQLADAKAALDSADSLTFSLSSDGSPPDRPAW